MTKFLVALFSLSTVALSTVLFSATAFSQEIRNDDFQLAGSTVNFTVELQKVDSSQGTVDLAIYSTAAGFPDKGTPIRLAQAPAQAGTMQIQVANLPAGVYAMTVLHDDNGDGKMDYNGLGLPTKGFGFSNNPDITFSAPSFDDCKITVGDQSTSTVIVMKHY